MSVNSVGYVVYRPTYQLHKHSITPRPRTNINAHVRIIPHGQYTMSATSYIIIIIIIIINRFV